MGSKASPLCLRSARNVAPASSYGRTSLSSLPRGQRKVPTLVHLLALRVYPFQSCQYKQKTLKLVCNASSNGFFEENSSEQFDQLAQQLHMSDEDIETNKSNERGVTELSYMPFSRLRMDILVPALLGICPEPPDWPERDEIRRVSIELKANSVELPLSLRMLKRKQQFEENSKEAGEVIYCSVKKSFSSLVFIIQEVQKYALHVRGSMYCDDLQETTSKLHREINATFVWLFQQVFSETPTLMVNVMTLLANFTVSSMATNKAAFSISHLPQQQHSDVDLCNGIVKTNSSRHVTTGTGGTNRRFVGPLKPPQVPEFVHDDNVSLSSRENGILTTEEVNLWNSMLEESSNLCHVILDKETKLQLVSPVNVVLERDDYAEFFRTDLLYQMHLSQDPRNPLLRSNYAQFVWLVTREYERAEDLFRLAIAVEPPDAEAFSNYADFLRKVRNDLWAAEERYQQALAADPDNPYHGSKYASFLWSTGGDETCYP